MAKAKRKTTPKKQTAKKSHKKQEKKSLIDETIEKAAREAAQNAAQDVDDFDFDNDTENDEDFEDENTSSFSFNAGAASSHNHISDDVDIFAFGDEHAVKTGQQVRFWIKKNSEMMGPKDRPYSWERLIKEFGPGLYNISMRAKVGGQIIKQVTESVGNPNEGREEADTGDSDHNQAPQAPGFMELMTLTNQIQERTESKASSAAAAQSTSMATIVTTMMSMMTQSNQQFQTMLMESQKESRAAADRQMNLVMTLLTKNTEKKNDLDPLTLFKLLNEERKAGEQSQMKLMEIIDAKVEAAREDARAEHDDDEKEESIMKTAIKAFAPALAGFAQNAGTGGQGFQGPTPSQIEEQRIREENHFKIEQRNRLVEQQNRALANGSRPRVPQTMVEANGTGAVANPQNLPPTTQASAHAKVQPTLKQKLPSKENLPNTRQEGKSVEDLRQSIIKLVGDDVGPALILGQDALQTARTCWTKLEKAGFARQPVLEAFTLDYLLDLARSQGAGSKEAWIKEFHAAFSAPIDTESSTVPPKSGARAGREPIPSKNL